MKTKLGALLAIAALALVAMPAIASQVAPSACPEGGVPDDGFTDVRWDHAHELTIDCAVWWEVAAGRTADTFAPDRDVTRAQAASFLARVAETAGFRLDGSTDHFDDDTGPHETRINELASAGIIGGTAPRTFSPDDPLSRAQMAALLVRTYLAITGEDAQTSSDHFDDDNGLHLEPEINAAAERSLVGGVAARTYAPARAVTRAQMATFLTRLLDQLINAGALEAKPAGEGHTHEPPSAPQGPAGTLDTRFGDAGYAIWTHGAEYRGVNVTTVDPKGNVVLGAYNHRAHNTTSLVRFTPDGRLDPTFRGDGTVTVAFDSMNVASSNGLGDGVRRILNSPDGGYVIATEVYIERAEGTNTGPVDEVLPASHDRQWSHLVRYRPDGTIDRTFGDQGTIELPGPFHDLGGLVQHSNGDLVTVTNAPSSAGRWGNLAMARFGPDGAHESQAEFALPLTYFKPTSAQVDSQDRLVVVAEAKVGDATADWRWMVLRFLPDGSADKSFGTSGYVIITVPEPGSTPSLALGGSGIFVSGQAGAHPSTNDQSSVAVVQLRDDGSFEQSFGASGVARYVWKHPWFVRASHLSGGPGNALARGCDGALYVPVMAAANGPEIFRSAWGVVAFRADGTVATGFGDDGLWLSDERTGVSSVSGVTVGRDCLVYPYGPMQTKEIPERLGVSRVFPGG